MTPRFYDAFSSRPNFLVFILSNDDFKIMMLVIRHFVLCPICRIVEVRNLWACGGIHIGDMPWSQGVHGESIKIIVSNRCCVFDFLGFKGGVEGFEGWWIWCLEFWGCWFLFLIQNLSLQRSILQIFHCRVDKHAIVSEKIEWHISFQHHHKTIIDSYFRCVWYDEDINMELHI